MEIFLHPLFAGMTPEETAQMQALHAFRERTFPKGAYILRSGDRTQALGMVRAGGVHIESCDVWGERSILSYAAPGQVFAETYAVCGEAMMVDVVAAEDSTVVFLDLSVLLGTAQQKESWYPKLMQNLLRITARKNLTLSSRIFCTTARSVRGRLLTYLSAQAAQRGSCEFDIPFDRQQLADYLNLDRSALSKELGKMRDEGLLEFRKNHFRLHQPL